jgi:dTDP-4-dehydrorhamnose 3,5-epimerase
MSTTKPVSVPSLKVTPLSLPGLTLLEPKRHGDDRGYFCETYNRQDFESAGLNADFVQDNQSLSAQTGTLRGLHFQTPPFAQIKLIRVLRGAILDICVDIRHGSPTFGQHVGVTLSARNGQQLWVPEGFAHGFCTLEPDTEVFYKVSRPYAPAHDKGLLWNDPELAISWPLQNGIASVLSDKDRAQPPLSALPAFFEYSPKNQ